MIRIVPKPGAPIRHPVTRELLPAAGILVDRIDAHWRRREREGGVTITSEPTTTRAPELGPPPSEGGETESTRAPEQLGPPPSEE